MMINRTIMIPLVAHLLDGSPARAPIASLADFASRIADLAPGGRFEGTIDRAAAAGFAADRLGYAFAGGYRAALARLVPAVTGNACLCATEPGGAQPRFIRTALTALAGADGAWRLTGTKTWVTLGTEADELLVVASIGVDAEGKNRLKVVRVPASRSGITLRAKEASPFAPEIPHAEASLTDVAVSAAEVLEGDGYDAYLKPFRTIEDAHVLAATLGYLVAVARANDWPRAFIEQAITTLVALREIGAADPSRRETHIALAGALAFVRRLVEGADAHWPRAGEDERARWQRDRPLLEVAEKARGMRSEAAWRGASR
jgi:acyl-CoA dehydrogenase